MQPLFYWILLYIVEASAYGYVRYVLCSTFYLYLSRNMCLQLIMYRLKYEKNIQSVWNVYDPSRSMISLKQDNYFT